MSIFSFFKDDSIFQKSTKSLLPASASNADDDTQKIDSKAAQFVKSIGDSETKNQNKENQSSGKGGRPPQGNLKAVQVIERQGDIDPDKSLPLGTNFIGKLISRIDSRDPDLTVRVSIPYGANGKSSGHIDPNSLIMGKASYPGKGEKIFIKFNKGVNPQGQEFDIEAQALSSKDYSNGLNGDYHGTTDQKFKIVKSGRPMEGHMCTTIVPTILVQKRVTTFHRVKLKARSLKLLNHSQNSPRVPPRHLSKEFAQHLTMSFSTAKTPLWIFQKPN